MKSQHEPNLQLMLTSVISGLQATYTDYKTAVIKDLQCTWYSGTGDFTVLAGAEERKKKIADLEKEVMRLQVKVDDIKNEIEAKAESEDKEMTLDEAIIHAEEVSEENERLCEEIHPALQWKDYGKCASQHRQLAEWLKELKQLREQTSWIPVSERLPEVNQRVLVTSYGRVCYAMMISADANSGHPVFKLQDSLNERVVCETTVHSEFTTSRIKAWMPLPEPYKAERSDKE